MPDFPTTRTHEDALSFWHRYEAPLAHYGARRLRLRPEDASDLARDFCLKQLERERSSERPTVHETYAVRQDRPESRWWPSHGFRRFLATSFYRFCRDELAKRRGTTALDASVLDEVSPGDDEARDPLALLIVRDVLASVRDEVLEPWSPEDDIRRLYYEAKWPRDLAEEARSDAMVEALVGCTRSELRTAKRHVQDRIVYVLHRRVVEEGWSPDEARRLLLEPFAIVDALEAAS